MPMIYTFSLATAGNLTTNGTPNTETDAFFMKSGSGRNAMLAKVDVCGKGAGLSLVSGIIFRLAKLATASTSGTGMTPSPVDPGMQAAKMTMASRPTIGSTRTNRAVFGCGATTPNVWMPSGPDGVEVLEAGAANSLDMIDASGTASLTYEFSGEVRE